MCKLMVSILIVAASLFSAAAKSDECDISGIWEHSSKPAKLFVDLTKGEVSVKSHEVTPDSIGLVVLKSLKLASSPSSWNAKMYSAADDSFVDVQITSENCHLLIVSYHGEEVLKLLR